MVVIREGGIRLSLSFSESNVGCHCHRTVVSRRSWYEGVYMILSEPGDVHRRSCIARSPLLLPQSFCPSSVFYPTTKQMRVLLSSHPPSLPFSSLRIRPSSQSVQREPPRALQMHGFFSDSERALYSVRWGNRGGMCTMCRTCDTGQAASL